MIRTMPLGRHPARVIALSATCALLAMQILALGDLLNRSRAARALPSAFTDPLLPEKLGRALSMSGLHLAGTVLLTLLLLALWLPRWPDEVARTVSRAALPALCIPLFSALAWLIGAGLDLRYSGDANAIGMLGAVAGIFLPLLSAILVGRLRRQAGSRIAPLLTACILIELWSLLFATSALIMGLGA